jgi:hypothetical protein
MKQSPPEYHPFAVWVLLNLLFATGAAVNQLWPALAMISVANVALAVLAVRGGAARLES